MTCSAPFELVPGVGCIKLFFKEDQVYEDGLKGCQEMGGELFQFDDFSHQHQPLTDYLNEKNCKE